MTAKRGVVETRYRHLGRLRSIAIGEFTLGIEALERLVRRELQKLLTLLGERHENRNNEPCHARRL